MADIHYAEDIELKRIRVKKVSYTRQRWMIGKVFDVNYIVHVQDTTLVYFKDSYGSMHYLPLSFVEDISLRLVNGSTENKTMDHSKIRPEYVEFIDS